MGQPGGGLLKAGGLSQPRGASDPSAVLCPSPRAGALGSPGLGFPICVMGVVAREAWSRICGLWGLTRVQPGPRPPGQERGCVPHTCSSSSGWGGGGGRALPWAVGPLLPGPGPACPAHGGRSVTRVPSCPLLPVPGDRRTSGVLRFPTNVWVLPGCWALGRPAERAESWGGRWERGGFRWVVGGLGTPVWG